MSNVRGCERSEPPGEPGCVSTRREGSEPYRCCATLNPKTWDAIGSIRRQNEDGGSLLFFNFGWPLSGSARATNTKSALACSENTNPA